jgi:hypothetical protein
MSQWQDLGVIEGNDVTYTFDLTFGDDVLDLTGYTPKIVLKASAAAADNTGTTFTTSSGLSVVNAKRGKMTWILPHADSGTPGKQWWRLDVTDNSSNVATLMMGNLTVQAA